MPKAGRPPQQHTNTDNRDTQPPQRGTEVAPVVVRISLAQLQQLIAAQKTEHHQQEPAPDWWMIGLTGLVAAATILLWLATKDLVKGAERTAERQLRAYLTVRQGKIKEEEVVGGWWLEWQPQITNVGQTPAYDVRLIGTADILPDPLPEGKDLAKDLKGRVDASPSTGGSRSSIGAGQDLWPDFNPGGPISDAQLRELRDRLGTGFYVWGTVIYRDVFQKERRTNFGVVAVWDAGGKPVGRYIRQHNEAD